MINISEEDAKLFEQNGYSKEHVGATVNHYRQEGLSDDEIQNKINTRLSGWKNVQPNNSVQQTVEQPIQQPVMQTNLQVHAEQAQPQTGMWDNIKNSYNNGFQKFQEGYRNVGRHIPGIGNWLFGSQQEADLIKQDNNVPLLEELEQQYNQGLINKEQFKQQLNLRTAIDNAKADRSYRDVRNKALGKGTFEIGTALIPLGGAKVAGSLIAKGAGALAKNKVLAKYGAKGLQKLGTEFQERATQALANKIAQNPWFKIANHAGIGAVEGANYGALDYGMNNLLGYENENSLAGNIGQGALLGTALGTGIGSGIEGVSVLGKTKAVKDLGNTIRNQADIHPMLADAIVGLKNFLTSDIKFQNKKDNLAKLERLNEIKNKHRDFTPEQIKQLEEAEKISIDDFGKMHKELTEGGDTLEAIKRELGAKSGDTQVNQEIDKLAYEFKQKPFNELTEQEQNEFYQYVEDKFNKQFKMERAAKKQSEAPESNLSHVEEQTNTNLSKEDLTHVKSDSGMSNETNVPDGYIKDEFGNIVKENKPSKVQRWNKDSSPNQEEKIGIKSKAEIKRELNEQYKQDVKNNTVKTDTSLDKPITPEPKVTKLEPGAAEGSDSSFYYEQKVKGTKKIDADDAYIKPDEEGEYVKSAQGNSYENYVDENYTKSDILPEDIKSLKEEIKAKDEELKNSSTEQSFIKEKDRIRAEKSLKKILPSTLYKKAGNAESVFDMLFNNFHAKDGANANKLYQRWFDNIKSAPEIGDAKRAMFEALNNSAKKYTERTGIEIGTYSGASADSIKKSNVLTLLDKAIKEDNLSEVQSLLKRNKTILNQVKNERGLDTIRDGWDKLATKVENDIDNLLSEGKIEEAQKLFKKSENLLRNKYKDFSQAEKKVWEEGVRGKVGTGETWEGTQYDPYAIWNKKKAEFRDKLETAKNKAEFKESNKDILQTIKTKAEDALTSFEGKIKRISEHIDKATKIVKKNGRTYVYVDKIGNSEDTFGQAVKGHKTVLIKNGTKENIVKHEDRHLDNYDKVIDFIKNDAEGIKFKKDYTKYNDEYANSVEKLKDDEFVNKAYEIGDKLNEDVRNILFPGSKKGGNIYKEPENFAETLQKLGGEGKLDDLSPKELNHLTEYNEARYNYNFNVDEINANAFMNGKETGDIINAYKRAFKKRYGTDYTIQPESRNGQGVYGSSLQSRGTENSNIQQGLEKSSKTVKNDNTFKFEFADNTWDGRSGDFYKLNDNLNKSKSQFKTEGQKQTFKNLVKYAKDDEKDLIDLGIITKEQAANRLKQQHYKGEGVYIPSTHGTPKGNIDIEQDYNIGRKTKKGVFGEKKEYGVDREVDAKEVTKQTIKRHIDINHVKNVSNYIEEAFAEPITNGKVKDGYIAVNKNILNTMMYGKYSKDWFKTVSAGNEAIDKAFKDEALNLGWKDLYNRSKKPDYQIPESVFNKLVDGTGEKAAEWWDRYANNVEFGKLKGVGHWVGAFGDALMNGFKRRVLTSSSFFLNNRIGNQVMLAMNSDNPIQYLKSIKGATQFKNNDLPTEIVQNSILEAVQDSTIRHRYTSNNAIDNALNLFNGSLIETKNLKGLKKAGATAANIVIGLPNKAFNKISEKLMKFNQLAEDFERRQIFSQIADKKKQELIKTTGQKMIKQEEVLKHINSNSEIHALVVKEIEDTLGDYKNFSPAEQKVLKRIVPFYSWYRTITRHTVKVSRQHPERVALLALELNKLKEKADDRKEYQKLAFDTGITDKRSGKKLLLNKEHAIPYSTFREDIGINPYLQKTAEAIRGKKFFLDQEISNDRYTQQSYKDGKKWKKGYWDLKENKWVRDKEGKISNKLPLAPRLGYLGKEVLTNTVAPYLNNALINVEQLSALPNNLKNGRGLIVADKNYDASLGSYSNGDIVGIKNGKAITRYAGNDLSTPAKLINYFGVGLQNKGELNKKEKKEIVEKIKKRKAKFKKKAS